MDSLFLRVPYTPSAGSEDSHVALVRAGEAACGGHDCIKTFPESPLK